MNKIFEYDVFLSFSVADEEVARPIWQEMCLSGLRVFWSDASLKNKLGESWFEEIQSSLEKSRHFLLICSTSSMSSEWVKREYQAFFNHCYQRGKRRLVPLFIKGYRVSDLPLFLKDLESCRIEELKEITRVFGGSDIEELKRTLSIKEIENENLSLKIKNVESELVHYKQEQGKLNNQLLAYEKQIERLQSQLADQSKLMSDQEAIIKSLKERLKVKKTIPIVQTLKHKLDKSPLIMGLIFGVIVGAIVGFGYIFFYFWKPYWSIPFSLCVFGGIIAGMINRMDRIGLIYMAIGVVLVSILWENDTEKTWIAFGFTIGAPVGAIVGKIAQKIKIFIQKTTSVSSNEPHKAKSIASGTK